MPGMSPAWEIPTNTLMATNPPYVFTSPWQTVKSPKSRVCPLSHSLGETLFMPRLMGASRMMRGTKWTRTAILN